MKFFSIIQQYERECSNIRLRRSSRHGFSLLEILAVVAIISVILGISGLAVSSFSLSRGVDNAAVGIAGSAELARSYAMANNTYVWMGLLQDNNDLLVAVIYSRVGMNDYSDMRNLDAVNKMQSYKGVSLVDFSTLTATNGPMAERVPLITENASLGFNTPAVSNPVFGWPLAATTPTHSFDRVIEFRPDGSAKVVGTSNFEMMEIALQEANSNATVSDISVGNIATVQIDGITGKNRVFRP